MLCIANFASADQWIQKADFIGHRSRGVAFAINQKGYVGTGYSHLGFIFKDFWSYDSSNDSWTQVADLPGTERLDAFAFEAGGKGYVGGGWVAAGTGQDFWEYNHVSNSWIQKADFPDHRENAVAFSIDLKGYVGTGTSVTSAKSDFWEYNTVLNSWTQKTDFPGLPRCRAFGFSIGGKGYIGTGENAGQLYSDFYEYDTLADSWAAKADFGGGQVSRKCCFVVGDKGYATIGIGLTSFVNDLWQYNSLNDTWNQKLNFQGSAHTSAMVFAMNNCGYLCGGDSIVLPNGITQAITHWEYRPDSLDAIDELSFEESGLKIFPNPVRDFFNVHSKYPVLLSVYTEEGKEIFQNRRCENILLVDAQNWLAGIYYIKAQLNNRSLVYSLAKE